MTLTIADYEHPTGPHADPDYTGPGTRYCFGSGVTNECLAWLWDNVGPGNVNPDGRWAFDSYNDSKYKWFAARISMGDWSVPTVTIKDPRLAVLFALRWL